MIPIVFHAAADGRSFSVHRRGEPKLGWTGLGGAVEVDGRLLDLADAQVKGTSTRRRSRGAAVHVFRHEFPRVGLLWEWTITVRAASVGVTARLANTGRSPLVIGPWHVLRLRRASGGAIGLGRSAKPRSTTFFGWRPWDMRVERLGATGEPHGSSNLCHLHDPASGVTLLSAFTTLSRMSGWHTLACGAKGEIREYCATCQFGRYTLEPGRKLVSETLRLEIHTDPYAALEQWAEAIRRAARPRLPDLPPVGWVGFSWADAFQPREGSFEQVALANAKAIREKLRGFDVRYLWISQMNLKDAIPGNWLKSDPRHIPSGLPKFFGKLKKLGFVPGLWIAPY